MEMAITRASQGMVRHWIASHGVRPIAAGAGPELFTFQAWVVRVCFFLPLGHFKCLGHPSCLCLCCGRFSYSLEGLFHGRGNWGLHFLILLATEARRHQISILLAEVGVFETEVAHAPLHARLQATRASHDSAPEVGGF